MLILVPPWDTWSVALLFALAAVLYWTVVIAADSAKKATRFSAAPPLERDYEEPSERSEPSDSSEPSPRHAKAPRHAEAPRRALASPGSGPHGGAAELVDPADPFPSAPRKLHLEMAMQPPSGSLQVGNPPAPYEFHTDSSHGRFLLMHPPAEEEGVGLEPHEQAYAAYFAGKKRTWELRMQFVFVRPPPADAEVFFGCELGQYVPLSLATKRLLALTVNTLRAAVSGLHHSPGDDPALCRGEVERPGFCLPLIAFDQFVETLEGERPPDLLDPLFPKLGVKRYQRVQQYAGEIAALQKRFRCGCTYTFSFWGSSRFADVLGWRLVGIPMAGPINFERFMGQPPIHCVVYSVDAAKAPPCHSGQSAGQGEKGGQGAVERRHLQSRKQYYFRAALWTSLKRPELGLLEELTGCDLRRRSPRFEGGGMEARAPLRSLQRKVGEMAASFCSCVSPRCVVSPLCSSQPNRFASSLQP